MGETYKFFGDDSVTQPEWKTSIGNNIKDGVICGIDDDLYVYADTSGMQIKMKAGSAYVKAIYYTNSAEKTISIGAAPSTVGQSRYDLLVIEVDFLTYTAAAKIVEGTASASPAYPSLTQTDDKWQMPIAVITVDYGDVTIANTAVEPIHAWALGVYSIPLIIGNGLAVIDTGEMPVGVVIPMASKIFRIDMMADQSGSIVVDLWADLMANYPPTVADTICDASNKPTLSTAQTLSRHVWDEDTNKNANSLYWTTIEFDAPVHEDDDPYILLPNVDSIATCQMVNLTIWLAKKISPQA